MESIIFFVIAMGINLIFKSANDKKKIEAARRKRAEQLRGDPMADDVSQQMEKWNKEAENRQKRVEKYNVELYEDTKKEENPKKSFESISYVEILEHKKSQIKESDVDISIKNKMGRKKIINAIIWSEILGEPKSIQNIKRDM